MKRNMLLVNVLSLTSICLTIISCGKIKTKTSSPADLFFAYSTENLMSDWDYLAEKDEDGDVVEENQQYLQRDSKLRFNCLKGENEGMQLMIHANKYISDFDFKLPTLTNGSETIDSSNFSVSVAWYLECSGTNERNAYAGYYPDALIPLENYKFRRMNHIDKGFNQALYFNFLSTEQMKAGTYTGEGTLVMDSEEVKIPFEVRIYNGVMPNKVHQKSCFLIWYEQIVNGELNNATPEMGLKYYNFLASKRVTPDQLPDHYTNTPEVFAESMANMVADNDLVTVHRFPIAGSSINETNVKAYLNALITKNIELRQNGNTTANFFDKLCFYLDDEPTSDKFSTVKGHDKIVYDAKADLSYRLENYPDLYDSFVRIPNIVTTPFTEQLVGTRDEGGVQCWCPQFSHFTTPQKRAVYAERQALPKNGEYKTNAEQAENNGRVGGEDVWWYGCMDPQSPLPSFHLDADLLNSRILRYMQFDYNISGSIYWCVNYFSKYQRGQTLSRDIWTDPISWEKCAGDGMLLYPGVEFGIDGPMTTLRLESILGSNEEYEYLWMIEQMVNKYNNDNDANLDAKQLLREKILKNLYTNMYAISEDEVFNENRLVLLDLVETMTNDLNSGIAKLLRN